MALNLKSFRYIQYINDFKAEENWTSSLSFMADEYFSVSNAKGKWREICRAKLNQNSLEFCWVYFWQMLQI